jgi:D-arabinose 1-dehydrogenase-like Zn-dependent alcohol dehydrogenase
MVRNGGALLEIGNISLGNTAPFEPAHLVWGSRRVYGVYMYDPWVIPKALDFLVRTRNKYPFDKIMSHKYKLDDINKAFEEAEWKAAGAEKSKITRAFIVP